MAIVNRRSRAISVHSSRGPENHLRLFMFLVRMSSHKQWDNPQHFRFQTFQTWARECPRIVKSLTNCRSLLCPSGPEVFQGVSFQTVLIRGSIWSVRPTGPQCPGHCFDTLRHFQTASPKVPTVTVLTVLAVVAVSVVMPTPLKLNLPFSSS